MLNIECYTCGKISTIDFDEYNPTSYDVKCPFCNADINLLENELNIDWDEYL